MKILPGYNAAFFKRRTFIQMISATAALALVPNFEPTETPGYGQKFFERVQLQVRRILENHDRDLRFSHVAIDAPKESYRFVRMYVKGSETPSYTWHESIF